MADKTVAVILMCPLCGYDSFCRSTCAALNSSNACTATPRKGCPEIECSCVWQSVGAGRNAFACMDSSIAEGQASNALAPDATLGLTVFLVILAVWLAAFFSVAFRRFRRRQKAERILQAIPSNIPDAPILSDPNDLEMFQRSKEVMVCIIEPREEPSQGCSMCSTQRVMPAAICSSCGRGLFLVASNANLEEEDRRELQARARSTMLEQYERLEFGRLMSSPPQTPLIRAGRINYLEQARMIGGETSPWCRPRHTPPILQATVGFSGVSPEASLLPSSSSSPHSLPSSYSEGSELSVGWGRQRSQADVQYGQHDGALEGREAAADVVVDVTVEEPVRTRQLVENMTRREVVLSDFALPNSPIRST